MGNFELIPNLTEMFFNSLKIGLPLILYLIFFLIEQLTLRFLRIFLCLLKSCLSEKVAFFELIFYVRKLQKFPYFPVVEKKFYVCYRLSKNRILIPQKTIYSKNKAQKHKKLQRFGRNSSKGPRNPPRGTALPNRHLKSRFHNARRARSPLFPMTMSIDVCYIVL